MTEAEAEFASLVGGESTPGRSWLKTAWEEYEEGPLTPGQLAIDPRTRGDLERETFRATCALACAAPTSVARYDDKEGG